MQVAHNVLQYIKDTIGRGVFFSSNSSLQLKVFADVDWVTPPDTQRSVSGYYLFNGDCLVS